MSNGYVNNNNKTNTNRVRAVARVPVSSATPQVVYDIPFSSIIEAWIDCERNKRSSNSCTKFRWHAARDLVELWQQMRSGKYIQRTSMCFIVTYPVLREVWAASFRDRIAHHWEDLRFRPVMEEYFVEVGDRSMNCRKGYGSLRAVNQLYEMIWGYTDGYSRDDCYIVGGDFANFFMSIDKDILWEALREIMMARYKGDDLDALLYMMRTTLYHSGPENFFRKSPKSMWNDLPPRKSLFHMPGLEIGNLPNQIWANFIGAIFTDWAIRVKHVDGFIIFVDDFRFLARSAEEGRKLMKDFKKYLAEQLHVTLHPDKVYLQHYTKGGKMTGAVLKPGRIYVSNRTRGHFISRMMELNRKGVSHRKRMEMLDEVRASVNSYLGIMCHYKSYNIRKKICEKYILPVWGKYIFFEDGYKKCIIRKEYDQTYLIRKRLKKHKYAAKFIRPKW